MYPRVRGLGLKTRKWWTTGEKISVTDNYYRPEWTRADHTASFNSKCDSSLELRTAPAMHARKIRKNFALEWCWEALRGNFHTHTTSCSLHNRQKEVKNLTRKVTFHTGISSPAFKKRRKIPPCPRNNALTTACSKWAPATAWNSCSPTVNSSSKQPSPVSSENPIELAFLSLRTCL